MFRAHDTERYSIHKGDLGNGQVFSLLLFHELRKSDGATWECILNSHGTEDTTTARVTVLDKGIQTGLYEIQPTRSENAIIGEMKELNCFPGSKHFWLQCSDDTGCKLIVPSPKFDITDNYLTIKNVEAGDGGRYR